MPIAEREAEVVWEGSLARGSGSLTSGSRVLDGSSVTWAARTEAPNGKDEPRGARRGCPRKLLRDGARARSREVERDARATRRTRRLHVGRGRRSASDHPLGARDTWTRLQSCRGCVRRGSRRGEPALPGLECPDRRRGDHHRGDVRRLGGDDAGRCRGVASRYASSALASARAGRRLRDDGATTRRKCGGDPMA